MCNLANAFKCISYVILCVFLVDFRNLGARIWESGGQRMVKLQSVLAVYIYVCLSRKAWQCGTFHQPVMI